MTNYYYVAGINLQGEKKVTAFVNLIAAWNHATQYGEKPIKDRGTALAYIANNDPANIETAETHVSEAEKWAVALPFDA